MRDHEPFDEPSPLPKEPALRSQNRFWTYLLFIVLVLALLLWLSLRH